MVPVAPAACPAAHSLGNYLRTGDVQRCMHIPIFPHEQYYIFLQISVVHSPLGPLLFTSGALVARTGYSMGYIATVLLSALESLRRLGLCNYLSSLCI